MNFFEVRPYAEAVEMTKELIKKAALQYETVPLQKGLFCTLSKNILSKEDLPPFDKSTVDGYAVKASNTYGATESVPTLLKVAGKVEMGTCFACSVKSGEAVYVPTGARMPDGADAAVMIENCEMFGSQVAVYKSAAPFSNVLQKGVDALSGSVVAKRGETLSPFMTGVFAGLGISEIEVYKPLRFAVISTGDELKDIGEEIKDGEIRDVNTYALSALIKADGHEVVYRARCKDNFDELFSSLQKAAERADIVLLSGGSSVGEKDYTFAAIERLCGNVKMKGIALKPGKPTIAGGIGGVSVFGLPGHPMAAAVVYEALIGKAVAELRGQKKKILTYAKAKINFPSSPGRTTCQPVTLHYEDGNVYAEPVFSKSGVIRPLAEADGYVMLSENAEGVNAGETLEVLRFGK